MCPRTLRRRSPSSRSAKDASSSSILLCRVILPPSPPTSDRRRLRSRHGRGVPRMAFSPASIDVRRVRQRAVSDESGRSVAEGFRPSVAILRRRPRRVEKSFGILHPFRRLMSVQHRHVLDRGREKCIPPRRAGKRRPSPQNPPLLFPAAGVEQAGRLVNDQAVHVPRLPACSDAVGTSSGPKTVPPR